MDSDCVEANEDEDLSTVGLADKGKGVDPQEYGGALYNPKSMIVPSGTTSTGGSDVIELVDIHRDRETNTDPEEIVSISMAYDTRPISALDNDELEFMGLQFALLESLEPGKPTGFNESLEPGKLTGFNDSNYLATDLNDGLPYDPTLPQPRWHPKISPYRFAAFFTPLIIGTVRAVLSQKESFTTPITLEWINAVVLFLV